MIRVLSPCKAKPRKFTITNADREMLLDGIRVARKMIADGHDIDEAFRYMMADVALLGNYQRDLLIRFADAANTGVGFDALLEESMK